MGENPIKEKIRLKKIDSDYRFFELEADGTARAIYVDDDGKSDKEEITTLYKYSYDDKNKTITIIVEKDYYESFLVEGEGQLLTYSEFCSKINEEYTVKAIREYEKKYYEKEKDDKYFKEDYPECNSYEDYEAAIVKNSGFDSFDAYVENIKKSLKTEYKACFSAKITYAYEIDGDKITLTEKFTGVKNLSKSRCRFFEGLDRAYIDCCYASIDYYNDSSVSYYYGYGETVDTDNKTITFVSEKDRKDVVESRYTENIKEETVTIKFKDKEYVCKFEADKYIQVDK